MAIDISKLNQAQLGELAKRVELRQEQLAQEKVTKLREKWTLMAKAEGIALEDVFGRSAPARGVKKKVKPKYRNPADALQTWSGRGKRPRWFHEALAAGKKEKDMLIG